MENGKWKMEKPRLTPAVTALRSAMENGKCRFGKPFGWLGTLSLSKRFVETAQGSEPIEGEDGKG
jgi:hypothetical protein